MRSLLALLFLLAAPSVSAQTLLQRGVEARGSLSEDDPLDDDGVPYDLWTFTASAGETLVAILRAATFDAHLVVGQEVDGTFEVFASADDGAGGTDARLVLEVHETGTYALRATALDAEAEGAYTLRIDRFDSPATSVTTLRPGTTHTGALDARDSIDPAEGYRFEHFRLNAPAEQLLTVTLTSSEFDAYLELHDVEGNVLAFDDDGAGSGTDAALAFEIIEPGPYVLVVRPIDAEGTGSFTLRATLERLPPVVAAAPVVLADDETVEGELTRSDPRTERGRADLFVFEGRAGDRLVVTVSSERFDSYAEFGVMEGGTFVPLFTDDDGAGDLDALLDVTLREEGRYFVRVTSADGALGTYEVATSVEPGEVPGHVEAGTLRRGETVQGTLPSGVSAHLWRLEGRSDDEVSLLLRSSDFDARLAVGTLRRGFFVPLDSDDDGAGGTDALLTLTLDGEGPFFVQATSFDGKGTGRYDLAAR